MKPNTACPLIFFIILLMLSWIFPYCRSEQWLYRPRYHCLFEPDFKSAFIDYPRLVITDLLLMGCCAVGYLLSKIMR